MAVVRRIVDDTLVDTAPRSIGDGAPLSEKQLLGAAVHWPSERALAEQPKFAGRKATQAAESLGLRTVGALLEHLPRDRREARTVAELVAGEQATVVVEVQSISSRPVRRRGMRPLVEALVKDQTGPLQVTFFNQPWLVKRYPPGTRLVLHGTYEARNRFRASSHAPTSDELADGSDVAHYPAAEGLSSTQILAVVGEYLPAARLAPDPLPGRLRARHQLPDLPSALLAGHGGELEAARRRLAFDELLYVQLDLLRRRARRALQLGAPKLTAQGDGDSGALGWISQQLPFELTGDQQSAVDAVFDDLARGHPMQRLLMGEVGSGKTVIALAAMLRAVENGHQAAMMAPTETLANQHFATIQALMPGQAVPVALLTGSTPAARRRDILGKLASGELGIVVGTHALIEDDVVFDRLAVAVVDEQHRFGVRQRIALDAKAPGAEAGSAPHILHMTATPIPRTLALLGYGDLDVTELRELPKGRQPIETHLASGMRDRARAYERIREELNSGRQAYVVCPLVEQSQALQARAATAEYERLAGGEFADYRVALIHGQMRSADKTAAMAAFTKGEVDVLVATTVIEVGVDVANATVMLIENAERYGLSQLHQLRGRVGRGEHSSVCLCFGPKQSGRLTAFAAHNDGFKLAEIDLQLRGEGELTGTRQSGAAAFRFVQMPDDIELLERARLSARQLIEDDAELELAENLPLREALERARGSLLQAAIPA